MPYLYTYSQIFSDCETLLLIVEFLDCSLPECSTNCSVSRSLDDDASSLQITNNGDAIASKLSFTLPVYLCVRSNFMLAWFVSGTAVYAKDLKIQTGF